MNDKVSGFNVYDLVSSQVYDDQITISTIENRIKNTSINYSEPHILKYYSIIVIEEGTYIHTVDFKQYELQRGNILVISPNQLQKVDKIEGFKGYVINFEEDFVLDYVLSNSNQICAEMVFRFHQYNKIEFDENSFQQIQLLIQVLIKELERENSKNQRIILQNVLSTIIIYMYTDNNVEIDQDKIDSHVSLILRFKIMLTKGVKHSYDVNFYAKKLNVSTRTLQMATKKVLNQSPKDLITHHLVLEMKRNLMNMNLKMKLLI